MIRSRKLLGALALLLATPLAHAGADDFLGYWKNQDDSGLVKYIQVKLDKGKPMIRAYGRCQKGDCYWGGMEAMAFAPSEQANLEKDADAVGAYFGDANAKGILILTKGMGKTLKMDAYASFPKSKLTNVHKTYTFVPAPELQGK
jgi:hypothetical protein